MGLFEAGDLLWFGALLLVIVALWLGMVYMDRVETRERRGK